VEEDDAGAGAEAAGAAALVSLAVAGALESADAEMDSTLPSFSEPDSEAGSELFAA
jgi:hypothetical protein